MPCKTQRHRNHIIMNSSPGFVLRQDGTNELSVSQLYTINSENASGFRKKLYFGKKQSVWCRINGKYYLYHFGGEKMERDEMPVGFAMALAQNPEAMEKFSLLSEAEKRKIIDGTHSVKSRNEMHRYVNSLAPNKHTD